MKPSITKMNPKIYLCIYIYNISTWNSKKPVFYGCFNWMIQHLYIGNGCFTKHPLKTGCLGFQVYVYKALMFFTHLFLSKKTPKQKHLRSPWVIHPPWPWPLINPSQGHQLFNQSCNGTVYIGKYMGNVSTTSTTSPTSDKALAWRDHGVA